MPGCTGRRRRCSPPNPFTAGASNQRPTSARYVRGAGCARAGGFDFWISLVRARLWPERCGEEGLRPICARGGKPVPPAFTQRLSVGGTVGLIVVWFRNHAAANPRDRSAPPSFFGQPRHQAACGMVKVIVNADGTVCYCDAARFLPASRTDNFSGVAER